MNETSDHVIRPMIYMYLADDVETIDTFSRSSLTILSMRVVLSRHVFP